MSGEAYSDIIVETSPDKVATITINRPHALNSFTWATCQEFRRAWVELAEDTAVNVIVLRGAGDRAFSTGKDVRVADNVLGSAQIWNQRDPGELLGPKQSNCWKPVICAVHGLCAGGAFYWLNEADIVICSDDAQFFDPHVTYGQVAALEPIGLSWRIPIGEVLRMTLMGNDERIGAETAMRIGLVSEITSAGTLVARAHEIAATIASKPTAATQGSVRAIWDSLDLGRTAGLHAGLKYCQLGNPIGRAEVDRSTIMSQAKSYKLR